MITYKRICIKDYRISDSDGNVLELKRGEEYTTSEEENNKVVVFSRFWARISSDLFAGAVRFT